MIHIRKAVTSDKQQILAFCQNTFSWGDYIHEVYDSWIDEGDLVVFEEDGNPIAICHGVIYSEEEMLWIEGIRVRSDYRRSGLAEKLVLYIENNAKNSGIKHSSMLIESQNKPSLNLAKKIGYNKQAKWNYIPVESKKISLFTNFDSISFDELAQLDIRYVESWRWIPLIHSNFKKLNSNGNILCIKNTNSVQSLGIISESNSFENTIILTIIFGTVTDIEKMISYTQNLSVEKKCSKIRVLTKYNDISSVDKLEKKFPFYLLVKQL